MNQEKRKFNSKNEELYRPLAEKIAIKYGLDPELFARQIQQESGWNPKAHSSVGAGGLSQFMPGTAKQYNTTPEQLKNNPELALEVGAKHMRKLTDTYGDQRLALAGFNGGGGSIDFVKQKLKKDKITYEDWIKFNEDRRAKLGASTTAWHGQTLDYVKRIAGSQSQQKVKPAEASIKPVQKQVPIVQPPIQQTPQIQAPTPSKFDYFEALVKQRQGNPGIPEVPQSASQTPLLPSGQPDPQQQRLDQITQAYQTILQQRKQQTEASLLATKQQEEQKQNQQRMLEQQRALQQFAQSFEQPKHRVILEPTEITQDVVQMQQIPIDAYTRTYGGLSQ